MGARIRCKKCRRQFTRPHGSNRLNCLTCRPPRGSAAPPVSAPADGDLQRAVRVELERLQQASSVAGAVALRLARSLDDPELGAAQVSSISAQLIRTLEPLAKGAPRPPDELDEFTRRLEEKRATA
jgi:hypothetical protein